VVINNTVNYNIKIMRTITIICLTVLLCFNVQSQDGPPENVRTQIRYHFAKRLITGKASDINFDKAFKLFQSCATTGHAPSMNALGIMYKDGLGCEKDLIQAKEWFRKAALAGYQKANYNLGLMYKYGNGVSQNDTIAYQYFLSAAEGGYSGGMYGAGYMLYTGQGVEQSYAKSIKWLTKGAETGRPSCMYLLGLCYRNGYGIDKDVDKARELMVEAADLGYVFAKDELHTKVAENNKKSGIGSLKNASVKKADPMKSGKKVKNIKVQGQWQGTKTTYDFSGKHTLKEEQVMLNLTQKGKHITGTWIENDSTLINIEGTLADNALYFIKGHTKRTDRYKRQRNWQLQQGKLEAVQLGDTIYLSCKLREYSPDIMELGQPVALLFKQVNSTQPTAEENQEQKEKAVVSVNSSTETVINTIDTPVLQNEPEVVEQNDESTKKALASKNIPDLDEETVQDATTVNKPTVQGVGPANDNKFETVDDAIAFKAYPNPFIQQCTVEYTLNTAGNVLVNLYDMNGRLVQNHQQGYKEKGGYEIKVGEGLTLGTYLVTIITGNQRKSQIIVKSNK
jgi:TPR repeat protein